MDPKKIPSLIELSPSYQLDNPAKWSLQGSSKAGKQTGLLIKELKVLLDCGVNTYIAPRAVFLSHYHVDHSSSLPYIIHRRAVPVKGQEHLQGRPVYMPESAHPRLVVYQKAIINLCVDDLSKYQFKDDLEVWKRQGIHPFIVKPGQVHSIPGLINIKVEIHPAYHNAESVGYGFNLMKSKLKAEYASLKDSKEGRLQIQQLAKSGTNLTEIVEEPQVIFFADSNIWNLTLHSEWKKYPVVICECTGFPTYHHPDSDRVGRQRSHTHLPDLLPVLRENKDKHWVLIHTSMTMSNQELDFWEEKLRREEGLNLTIVR